jgi:hypothetical protein
MNYLKQGSTVIAESAQPILWDADRGGFVVVETNTVYTQPGLVAENNPVAPLQVTLFQARTQLRRAGLFDAVDAYIEHHKSTDPESWEAWNYANNCYRNSELVVHLGTLLGLTSAEMDQLFVAAALIEV